MHTPPEVILFLFFSISVFCLFLFCFLLFFFHISKLHFRVNEGTSFCLTIFTTQHHKHKILHTKTVFRSDIQSCCILYNIIVLL